MKMIRAVATYLCYAALAGVLIGGNGHLFAQSSFNEDMEAGRQFLQQKDYLNAYLKFQAAEEKAGPNDDLLSASNMVIDVWGALQNEYEAFESQIASLNQRISSLQGQSRDLSDSLAVTRERLSEERRRLKRQIQRAEAQRLTLLAFRETEKGDAEGALALSFLASKLAEKDRLIHQSSLERAFGDAVFQLFRQEILTQGSELLTARFSPVGQQLLVAYHNGALQRWRLSGDTYAIEDSLLRDGYLLSTGFSEDGHLVYAAYRDIGAGVRVWPVAADTLFHLPEGPVQDVNGAAFLNDSERLLAWSRDGNAYLWNLENDSVEVLKHGFPVQGAAGATGGHLFLTRGNDNRVVIWDGAGRKMDEIQHERYVYSAAFSPDGKHILTASADKTAILWSAGSQAQASPLTGHHNYVTKAIFNHHGDRLLTTSADSTARLWDLDGDLLLMMEGHDGWVVDAAFAPDDNWAFTRTNGWTPMLWDLENQTPIPLSGHRGKVRAAAFSPGGRYILTASDDGTAKLWDYSGNIVMNLTGFDGPVLAVDFSADGKFLLAGCQQGRVVICPLPNVVMSGMEAKGFRPTSTQIIRYGIRPDWERFFDVDLKKP
jgi:WD40 repeat protein